MSRRTGSRYRKVPLGFSCCKQSSFHGNVRVKSKGLRGQTVLHNAAMAGDEKMITLLLAHSSINIKVRDDDGNTPVIQLIQFLLTRGEGHSNALISLLSKSKLDINAHNLNSNTALLIAASLSFEQRPD